MISAVDDVAAVATWLAEYENSPRSFRTYRREAERFLNWLAIERAAATISTVTREDVLCYQRFLADPQPAERWCASRRIRRADAAWRPFEGPLAPASVDTATAALSSLYGYLVDVGYLRLNPMARQRNRRGMPQDKSPAEAAAQPRLRHLPAGLLEAALEALRDLAAASPDAHFERGLFILEFLAFTGLRRAELAMARRRDLLHVPEVGSYLLRVVGKGNKTREVVVGARAQAALERYWQFHGLSLERAPAATPLVLDVSGSRQASGACVSEATVYGVVDEALRRARQSLAAQLDPVHDQLLAAASPHWLRRTYATLCLERGIGLKHLQAQLGHSVQSTTLGYQTSELVARAAALESVG